jgi:hypothetical protein
MNAYKEYLHNRIQTITNRHYELKRLEKEQTADFFPSTEERKARELLATSYNSLAACAWDVKAELELALTEFNKRPESVDLRDVHVMD